MYLGVEEVFKTYKSGFFRKRRTEALKGVTLEVRKGEILGLLGPNGAGKTTLLNIFTMQLEADSGRVFALGKDITRSVDNVIKTRINMCSGNPNFPWSLTVEETLIFYSLLYGLCLKARRDKVQEVIRMFELEKFAKTRYDELSTGGKQRLALAKSLLNDPEILFLDEPTIGLDPDMAKKVRELVLRIHKERKITIILTTHYMKEAEELCERIVFIKDGEIKAMGTKEELEAMTKTEDMEGVFLELA
jgi:ABC-2 type transport system ATP-binding protein